MTDHPFAIVEPTLSAIRAGRCTRLYRLESPSTKRIAIGDRLWVREKFFFPRRFDCLAPVVAASRGAQVLFGDSDCEGADQGRSHFARAMPKSVHRSHLIVTGLARYRLRIVSLDDIQKAGFPNRGAFNASILAGSGLGKRPSVQSDDPDLIAIAFTFHDTPLPAAAPCPTCGRGA